MLFPCSNKSHMGYHILCLPCNPACPPQRTKPEPEPENEETKQNTNCTLKNHFRSPKGTKNLS
jgi:hypothetical protein